MCADSDEAPLEVGDELRLRPGTIRTHRRERRPSCRARADSQGTIRLRVPPTFGVDPSARLNWGDQNPPSFRCRRETLLWLARAPGVTHDRISSQTRNIVTAIQCHQSEPRRHIFDQPNDY